MIKLSRRLMALQPSATIKLDYQAKTLIAEGKDIINLTAGELDFAPLLEVIDAAQQAIAVNHHYSPVAGLPELRDAVVKYLAQRHQLHYTTNQIVITNGVKQALYSCLQALVQDNDEVIVLVPAWVSYTEQIQLAGGKAVSVETTSDFQIDFTRLTQAVTPKTVGLIINYPNNPTGAIYPEVDLQKIAALAKQYNLWVISDEVYEQLVYTEQATYRSFAHFLPEQTIIVNGVSKSGALTGWRLGFVAAPVELATALAGLQSHLCGNVANVVQYTAVKAFQLAEQASTQFRSSLMVRRQLVLDWVQSQSKLALVPPQGAFYCFINITQVTEDAVEFCERLLNRFGVALVPGNCFGRSGYVRLSFAQDNVLLQQALVRIQQCLESYH